MVLNTTASISFSQINSTVFFTNGNMGIGTTTPTSNVDVVGTIKASGLSSLSSITTGTLSATNATTTNLVSTNVSTGAINSTGLTTGNINFTGSLYQNGTPYLGSQWTTTAGNVSYTSGSVVSTNIVNTNLSTGTLNGNNATISNIVSTNFSSGSIISPNAILTNATIANFTFGTNVTMNNLLATNVNLGVSNMFSSSFVASNNVAVATDVTGFSFANANIRSFNASVSISIILSAGSSLYGMVNLNGTQNANGWSLYTETMGDTTGITFTITNAGQIQYTSTNQSNWSSTTFRFNVQQFTATGTYSSLSANTQGSYIMDSVQLNSTTDAVSGVSNGGLYLLGGATITKSLNATGGVSTGTITASTGITTGTINATGTSTLQNVTATNMSSSTLIATTISASTLIGTTITGGSLSLSGNLTLAGTLTTVNITTTNVLQTNVSAGTIAATNSTITNSVSTNVSTGSINVGTSLVAIGNSNTLGSLFTTGGNVGINTSSPISTLTVNGDIRITTSVAGNNTGLSIGRSGIQDWYMYNPTGSSNLRFYNAGFGDMMTLTSNGNIGIRTTSPGSSLHVAGSIPVAPTGYGVHMGIDPSTYSVIQLNSTAGSYIDFGSSGTDFQSRILSAGNGLQFQANQSAWALTIMTSGNVGIATSNPAYTLDVNGTMNASTSVSSGMLASLNATVTNVTSTNISTGVLIASTGMTTGTLNAITAITTGTINAYGSGKSIFNNVEASYFSAANLNGSIARIYSSLTIGTGNTGNWGHQTISANGNFPMAFCANRGAIGSFLFGNADLSTGYVTINNSSYTLDVTGAGRFSGALSKGSGSFDIPHPLKTDPKERLIHSFIEGPRCDLIYRGTKQLVNGTASINIDTDCTQNTSGSMTEGTFEALCTNPVYYLQNNDSFDRVKAFISGNVLTITCENNQSTDSIHWMVVAERKDQVVKDWNRTDANGLLITEYTENNQTQ